MHFIKNEQNKEEDQFLLTPKSKARTRNFSKPAKTFGENINL
jgi:hypothetical protein